MKRIPQISQPAGPPEYWRSLEHLADKPEVRALMEREFPEGASVIDASTRRTFLTLMSATFALMGLTGCVRRPEEKIVPYTKMPEHLIEGIPNFYATSIAHYGEALGLLVESHEGRPTKIEGNPEHPSTLGGTMPFVQGVVLDLYDPDRMQSPHQGGSPASYEEFTSVFHAKLDQLERDGGAGLRVLCGFCNSPSVARMKRVLQRRFPKARVHEYNAMSASEATAAARVAFGEPLRAHVAYDRAQVIVSADCDFLGTEPGAILASRRFARGRRVLHPTDRMSRLYVAEPAFTVTGMNADHRLAVPAIAVEDFLVALAGELAKAGVDVGALASTKASAGGGALDAKWLTAVARDLARAKGASAIVVGSRQPARVQALGHALNEALGNFGKTIRFTRPEEAEADHPSEIHALTEDMRKGAVDTLVILGGNPVYAAPGDADFTGALGHVPTKVYLTSHVDETAKHCDWNVPRAHELESWGDLRAHDGTWGLVQPLIAPMFDGKTELELLALMAKNPDLRGYDIVRATLHEWGVTRWGLNKAKRGGPEQSDSTTEASQAAAPAAGSSANPSSAAASSAGGKPNGTPPVSAANINRKAGAGRGGAVNGSPGLAAVASAAPAASVGAALASAVPVVASAAAGAASATAVAIASASAAPLASVAAPVVATPSAGSAAVAAGPVLTLSPFERFWRRALHDGSVRDSTVGFVDAKVNQQAVVSAMGQGPGNRVLPTAQALELTFAPDIAVLDGCYSNVAWLLEMPHPVTKITWDNAAWVSPKTAEALGLQSGDVVRLSVGGRSTDIPIWIVPGTAENSVQTHLGWGRKVGRIAEGKGFNVNPLRAASANGFHIAQGATLTKTGTVVELAVTQEHSMLEGRPIVRETTLSGFREDPKFAEKMVEHPPLLPLWEERKFDNPHKWGMVIDLNACTGCSACVIACQAENNIPTVGKEQVTRNREMHWLRIDRYFSGNPESPSVVNQPMACVQCENAPCENVCPVNATVHSPEGINEMVYNRCIGTRYCANNCPYKVRRFNFLDYHGDVPETVKMVHNPNVSVRMRGVMEKCTYCVQRIQSKKIQAKRENRVLKGDEVVSACAQACPTGAIVFGDLNDSESRVAQLSELVHSYQVLEELNTKPRTTYISKIRNPNPELA